MTRTLFALYLVIALGPLLAFAAAFAVRDRLARPRHPRPRGSGNGHGDSGGLEHTVEEARAP